MPRSTAVRETVRTATNPRPPSTFLGRAMSSANKKVTKKRPNWLLKNERLCKCLKISNLQSLFCAPGGNRTRTAVSGQGILSPSCLPFHHQGGSWDCKDRDFLAHFHNSVEDRISFRQIGARASAPQGPQMAFWAKRCAPHAEISHWRTALVKNVPWSPL